MGPQHHDIGDDGLQGNICVIATVRLNFASKLYCFSANNRGSERAEF
jgi:hypothetical protein